MSQHHPLDDLFSRKLGNHGSETPMHLWEKIDQKRDWKHKLLNQIKLHRQSLMLAFSLILLISVWQFSSPAEPTLGYFPLPTLAASASTLNTTPEPIEEKIAELQPAPIQKTEPKVTKREVAKAAQTQSIKSQEFYNSVKENRHSNLKETAGTTVEILPVSLDEPVVAIPDSPDQTSNGAGIQLNPLATIATLEQSLEEDRFMGLFRPEPKCAKFKHGQWFLYLDMMASPDIPIRSLKAKNNMYSGYLQNREQTESAEFSYSVGFRLSAVSGYGMAIRTGLNYSQINEQFNYYNENEERIIIDNTYGPDGEIIGTDTTIVSGVRHKVTHNKFQIVDLPLILGYEFDYKKFVFTVNAGVHINLYFESDGDFLSPDLEPVSFSSNDPNSLRAFRNHLGVGWYSSVGVQYKLSPRFNLMFEPHFKMYPKGFSRSQYMLDQQYLSMGFSIGIRQRI